MHTHTYTPKQQAILVSGLILGVAVAALSLVETDLVKTIGIAGSVGVAVALLCNLTLVPSLLLIFGECFQHCIRRPVCRCWCRKKPYKVRVCAFWSRWRGPSAVGWRCCCCCCWCCCCCFCFLWLRL